MKGHGSPCWMIHTQRPGLRTEEKGAIFHPRAAGYPQEDHNGRGVGADDSDNPETVLQRLEVLGTKVDCRTAEHHDGRQNLCWVAQLSEIFKQCLKLLQINVLPRVAWSRRTSAWHRQVA